MYVFKKLHILENVTNLKGRYFTRALLSCTQFLISKIEK